MLDCSTLRKTLTLSAIVWMVLTIPSISTAATDISDSVVPLTFVQKIPFVRVAIGSTEAELMFDSGGKLGITLPMDVIKRAGSVKILDHKSKHGDAAGNVYEVPDILASEVSVGGVQLASSIMGSVHYEWGLDVSSGVSHEPDELKSKRANGSIGLEAFNGKPLLFDYAHRELKIYRTGDLPNVSDPGWRALALEYGPQGPQVILTIGGRPQKFILDTGANTSLLMPSALDAARFPDICKNMPKGSNYCGHMDFTGVMNQAGDDIGDLAVELIEMKGVPFDGLLGADFFQSHLVLFDITNRRLWIKKS